MYDFNGFVYLFAFFFEIHIFDILEDPIVHFNHKFSVF